jgi:hypothetical protein
MEHYLPEIGYSCGSVLQSNEISGVLMYSILGSDVVLEGRPWPRGQKIMSLTSALRAVTSALILALTVLVLGLGLEGSTSGLD